MFISTPIAEFNKTGVVARWKYLVRVRALLPGGALFGALLMYLLLAQPVQADVLHTQDADRFARLLSNTGYRPSARELERHYLAPASSALAAFAPGRLGDASELADAVELFRPDYLKAISLCLPAAKRMERHLGKLLPQVQRYLGQTEVPDVYLLFGAGNSGGTSNAVGVMLALEVLCWFADTPAQAEQLVASFAVHEAVHFYQLKLQSGNGADSLLRQSLMEGLADYVAGELLGGLSINETARHHYGVQHEARLWGEFSRQRMGTSLGSWMYGPGAAGHPADLGYWIGKRIVAAYVQRSDDPAQALRTLLMLEHPEQILQASAYGSTLRSPAQNPPNRNGTGDHEAGAE